MYYHNNHFLIIIEWICWLFFLCQTSLTTDEIIYFRISSLIILMVFIQLNDCSWLDTSLWPSNIINDYKKCMLCIAYMGSVMSREIVIWMTKIISWPTLQRVYFLTKVNTKKYQHCKCDMIFMVAHQFYVVNISRDFTMKLNCWKINVCLIIKPKSNLLLRNLIMENSSQSQPFFSFKILIKTRKGREYIGSKSKNNIKIDQSNSFDLNKLYMNALPMTYLLYSHVDGQYRYNFEAMSKFKSSKKKRLTNDYKCISVLIRN